MTPRRGIGAVLALLAAVLLLGGLRTAVGAGDGRVVEASRVATGTSATASLDAGTFDVRQESGTGVTLAIRFAGAVEDTQPLALGPPGEEDAVAAVEVPSSGRYLLTAQGGSGRVVLVEPSEPDVGGALPPLLLGAILGWVGIMLVLERDPRVAFKRWSGDSSG